MRLLLGPPGSGKSTLILNEIRARLRQGQADFLLLVPTATMAEHLRNLLAREDLLVRPSAIQTLAGFLHSLTPATQASSPLDLEMLTAQVIEQRNPTALAATARSAGLAAAVASALDELSGAGCDSLKWDALQGMGVVPATPLATAIGSVFEGVEQELAARKLHLRSERINAAIRALRHGGLPGVGHVYLDGFFTLSLFELNLVKALAARTRVTLALPEWTGVNDIRAALERAGCETRRFLPVRSVAKTFTLAAPTREREVEQIALRLRSLHDAGTPWRESVVIVRGAAPYLPMLESAFDRFGIPCRAYFASPLTAHPVCRVFSSAIDAALNRFEHATVLDALRPAVTRAGRSTPFPRFEDDTRANLPADGLAPLNALASRYDAAPILDDLHSLAALAPLLDATHPPRDWPSQLRVLTQLIAPPRDEDFASAHTRRLWRARAEAMRLFFDTLAAAAGLLPDAPVALDVFWRDAQPALRSASLRVLDHRRDAVAIIDAYEARQWEAPYVFVCGLLEGDFPRRPAPDPVLGDDLRFALIRNGVPVKTRAQRDDEESFLLDIAFTRATSELVLSWPAYNEKGDPNLPSFRLASLNAAPLPTPPVRVRPTRDVPPLPYPQIDAVSLQRQIAQRHPAWSATSLESFVQCPFQFHARHTLKLNEPAPLPSERLDALVKGDILHKVLAEWHKQGGPIELIFDSVWTRAIQQRRIPRSHRVEHERIAMLRALRFFAGKARIEPGWRIFVEQPFELDLHDCRIKGRIDRYDVNDRNQARIFDFKYTGSSGLKRRRQKMDEGLSLQGGLYALAVQRTGLQPLSFEYCAVRGEIAWAGPTTPEDTAAAIDAARVTSETSALNILRGVIKVDPADRDACQWCEFSDACRVAPASADDREDDALAAG